MIYIIKLKNHVQAINLHFYKFTKAMQFIQFAANVQSNNKNYSYPS